MAGSDKGISVFGFNVGGDSNKAYIAVDLKVLDTETAEVVDNRTVEANSSGGGLRLSGSLLGVGGHWGEKEKTPGRQSDPGLHNRNLGIPGMLTDKAEVRLHGKVRREGNEEEGQDQEVHIS